jgi:hypothetical protein
MQIARIRIFNVTQQDTQNNVHTSKHVGVVECF